MSNRYSLLSGGSIRDDGPLPETVNDMIEAQSQYSEIIKGAEMILMLSSMLHSIGTGNMTPSWVKTVCIDINPAVVTKLADRGSGQAIGIVSDVGLFLNALAGRLGWKYNKRAGESFPALMFKFFFPNLLLKKSNFYNDIFKAGFFARLAGRARSLALFL